MWVTKALRHDDAFLAFVPFTQKALLEAKSASASACLMLVADKQATLRFSIREAGILLLIDKYAGLLLKISLHIQSSHCPHTRYYANPG